MYFLLDFLYKENIDASRIPMRSNTRVLMEPDFIHLPAYDKNYFYIYSRVFRERRERSPPLPKIVLPS